jgi:hypothetical protein
MGMKRRFWQRRSAISEEVFEMETSASVTPKRPRWRRMRVILTLALAGTVGGFLISYAFSPKYTSQASVLVEGQQIPASYVGPVITADFTQRVQTLSQEVLSPGKLRPMIQSLGVKPEDETKLISYIQENMQVQPIITSMRCGQPGRSFCLQ